MRLLRLIAIFFCIIGFAFSEIKNKGWWKNSIFYQIYPRSFQDSNGDGTGDLRGIISRLEHFVDLGIKSIWMSPINASPMKDNGYDVSDYLKIDPLFGTLDDFDELIKKAKKLGIRILLDFVPNHTSDQHQWFINSVNGVEKYKDYYVWHRGRKNNTEPPTNWISIFHGSAWQYNEKRDLWYFHFFQTCQADLNFTNPDVVQEMRDTLTFWLDRGVNGFRIDAPFTVYEDDRFLDEPLSDMPRIDKLNFRYLDHMFTEHDLRDFELIASWRKLIDDWTDSHNEEERILMTEDYDVGPMYYAWGSNIPLNFNLFYYRGDTSKPSEFKNIIDGWMNSVPPGAVANWVTSNHDRLRIATRYERKPDLMIFLVMVLPGIACVYYGDEIAMEDNMDITWKETHDPMACSTTPETYQNYSRDPSRTPFQWDNSTNANFSTTDKTWLPINKNYVTLNLENQKNNPHSPYNIFKTLAKLKNTSETLQNGSLITDVLNNDTVLVVSRQLSTEVFVLINNFDKHTQTVDVSNYLPGTENATVFISSRNSFVTWGSTVSVSNVEIRRFASLLLVGTIKTSI